MNDQKSVKTKVCVIGCGAAGLCALRHLADNHIFEFDAYERSDRIGGVWNYDEDYDSQTNKAKVTTSMYKNLRYDC